MMLLGKLDAIRTGGFAGLQQGFPSLSADAAASSRSTAGMRLEAATDDAGVNRTDSLEQRIVQLYDDLRPSLYRYLVNIGVSPPDMEEIVQEVFLRLYRARRVGWLSLE